MFLFLHVGLVLFGVDPDKAMATASVSLLVFPLIRLIIARTTVTTTGVSALDAAVTDMLRSVAHQSGHGVVFLFACDTVQETASRHGNETAARLIDRIEARMSAQLRQGDRLLRTASDEFAIIPASTRAWPLAACIRFCNRIMSAVEEPVRLGAGTIYATCSAGFCTDDSVAAKNPASVIAGARVALHEALRVGPSGIRGYSQRLVQRINDRAALNRDAARALQNGQITAWFQPQVSTDTGQITGFEALARWDHPKLGILPPSKFLGVIEETGQLGHLAEIMLTKALAAIGYWDSAGIDVPRVAINLSPEELGDPTLADRIAWELDRQGVAPKRLAVEILESVLGRNADDPCVTNIVRLAHLGCGIDLDDFGTGHASIASLRRFPVQRVKIDRSYVNRVDADADQRRMIHAILSLAGRLGIDTLAEGVETAGEHSILAQLGIGHIQGYHIACPMPLCDTVEWIRDYTCAIPSAPHIPRQAG